jgi:Tfp pilus assembly protein FimT
MNIKKNSRGITIMEIMIVAVIVGIVSTLAAPRFVQALNKLKLKRAGRDLISSLRLARSDAVSQRHQFGVYFDRKTQEYVLFKDIADLGSFTYSAASDSAIFTKILPTKVNFGTSTFPSFTIIFKPDGSASSSGWVEIHSEEDSCSSFNVDVLGSTGRVKLISGYVDQS